MDTLFLNNSNQSYSGNKGYLPLWEAMRSGQVEVVEIFIGLGADPDKKGTGKKLKGLTFLQYAAKCKYSPSNYKIAEVLVRHGANMDTSPNPNTCSSALDHALHKGNIKFLELFLENGASLKKLQSTRGLSPAEFVLMSDNDAATKEILLLLKKHGLDTSYHDDETGENLLHKFLSDYECRDEENEGNPALVVEALLDIGVPVDETDAEGETPLNRVAGPIREYPLDSYTDIAKVLIKRGADINRKGGFNGKTPLMNAIEHGNDKMVVLLLNSGVELEVRENGYGCTALHVACMFSEHYGRQIVELLIRKGANVRAKNKQGQFPFDLL